MRSHSAVNSHVWKPSGGIQNRTHEREKKNPIVKIQTTFNAIQKDEQSFYFTGSDLDNTIGKETENADWNNIKIESTYLEESTSGFGITTWKSSDKSKII